MLLGKFTLPKTDIRLVTIDETIYKIKLHLVKQPNRDEASYEEFFSNPKNQEDIEKIIIVSLTSKDNPQPIKTNNLTVYPYRKKWEIGNKLLFFRNKKLLFTCPYVYSFFIENKETLPKELNTESDQHKSVDQCDGTTLGNKRSDGSIPVSKDTKQATQQDHAGQINSLEVSQKHTEIINLEKSIKSHNIANEQSQGKTAQPLEESKDTNRAKSCTQPVINKYKPLFANAVSKYVNENVGEEEHDESEGEDNQSLSILDGIQHYDPDSVPKNLISERLSNSEDEIFTSAKENLPEKPKLHKSITLIPASSQTAKKHDELLDEFQVECKAKRKRYSVTEYLDANRHEVQEQDLQEQLRYQEMATPAEEKPGIEERSSSLKRVFSSVKRLMFG